MKVLMLPTLTSQKKHESGITRVIEAYHRYAPDFGIEFVLPGNDYDLSVVHAGASTDPSSVAMLHGLYWSADYNATDGEYKTNARIVHSLRYAKQITVPSEWTAKTIRRDLRVNPHIIPHGIEADEWQHNQPHEGYVLWNKNRIGVDVCDPASLGELAQRFPQQRFLTTFAPDDAPPNIKAVGLVPHAKMKPIVQQAQVYLSLVKETFCIGNLEAMASGVPILGWANGGNLELIEHGVNGYLAKVGDYDDLADGLDYCLRHRAVLGANGREMVKRWTWPAAIEKLGSVFKLAMVEEPSTIGVVIPVYNKPIPELERAIESVVNQTRQPDTIVVVDDGSLNETEIKACVSQYDGVVLVRQDNQGVAHARNNGISCCDTTYICCLDADDWLEPDFLKACLPALENDRSLGIAYTGMRTHRPDGTQGIGRWPGQADADKQMKGINQVPTCCLFRRKVWERLGGYRQRYAPRGAGSEDAELWLRMMAYGWRAEEVTPAPLFNYSWLSGQVSGDPNYREENWLAWHPWTEDKQYPFAAVTRPKHISHPVRQYDEPVVSVIIPVGPGHEHLVADALDSLEAQTFRKWEAIVVWDGCDTFKDEKVLPSGTTHAFTNQQESIHKAYPYVRFRSDGSNTPKGAGWARNFGAQFARAPFLFWLDADDYLVPDALGKFLMAWNTTESIIYSDYIRIIQNATKEEVENTKNAKRVIEYDEQRQRAVARFRAYDFDCQRAVLQPQEPVPYYWCLASCLVPKAWHDEIGGYDEDMESWEDADYAYRLVRAGHCFARVPDELVVVRAYTGKRLNRALQIYQDLIKYMRHKYESEGEIVGCGPGCGGRVAVSKTTANKPGMDASKIEALPDKDFIKCTYRPEGGNKGNHPIHGSVVNPLTGKKYFYGYHGAGVVISVHIDDVYRIDRHGQRVLRDPRKFLPLDDQNPAQVKQPPQVAAPTPEPEALPGVVTRPEPEPSKELELPEFVAEVKKSYNFQKLPGVTPAIAFELSKMGLETPADVLELGMKGLVGVKGIGQRKAEKIIKYLQQ